MTRETYRLVENIYPLYIINYIFLFLHPCIQLPIIPTQSLSFLHASAYYSTSLSYISLFLFLFHHFSYDILLLVHIHPYHPSDIIQPLSTFLFLFHIKRIQITRASLFPQVHNHCTSMSSFQSLLRANILALPSV